MEATFPWLRHHRGYLKNMRFRRGSSVHRGAFLNIHKYRLKASSCPNIYRNSIISLPKEQSEVSRFLRLFFSHFHFVCLLSEMVLRNRSTVKKHGRFFVFKRAPFSIVFSVNDPVIHVGGGALLLFSRTFDLEWLQ